MTSRDSTCHQLTLDPDAARALAEQNIVRDLDRGGQPHFLVKVPDLEQASGSEFGIQVEREEDGCVAFSVLLYDIPTEPVTYDLRFYPDQPDDLQFLRCLLDAAQFRLHPCKPAGSADWTVGAAQVFRLPANVLLRLKHYSLEWPVETAFPDEAEGIQAPPPETPPAPEEPHPPPRGRSPDPRDTVIRKLKEQVQTLRDQLQERDKRIIELEDELHEVKSRGRAYRLGGEKRPWWKRF